MGIFDGLPVPPQKARLREEISKIDECWVSARFDSLPHVVKILTSKDREGEIRILKQQRDVIEEVVDEVVHAYHSGFNKAIQNYSHILRLFSESTDSISALKSDLTESKNLLGSRNNQLHQLWYRSVTLRHIISLLDQIESVSRVPDQIQRLIHERQLYAAVQMHVQSTLMLDREGLQSIGALQDIRTDLTKLRGILFYKILDDLHDHLCNRGQFSLKLKEEENEDEEEEEDSQIPITMSEIERTPHSFPNGFHSPNTDEHSSEPRRIPSWLSSSTPDEFTEEMKKSGDGEPVHVKYLRTMVECLSMLDKVAAAGAMICQRLRPSVNDIIVGRIKSLSANPTNPKPQSMMSSVAGVSPLAPAMLPGGEAQVAAGDLISSVLDTAVSVLENHVIIGDLFESKWTDAGTADPETSRITGGYSVGFSVSVVHSECQQLICEILRAAPDSAEVSVVTAPSNRSGDGPGLAFTFRFADVVSSSPVSVANQGTTDRGWSGKKGTPVLQEGFGTGAVLPQQGIYLAASLFRPVLQFTERVSSLVPEKHRHQVGTDGLLSFVENFLKEHFLPTLFADYRKCVQQAVSSPTAFRPRPTDSTCRTQTRTVLPGLVAVDQLAREVLGWSASVPGFTPDLEKYVQTFLERAYERCRTAYTEAVLEKQSYMLIGRHDIEDLMRRDLASVYLRSADGDIPDADAGGADDDGEIDAELVNLLLDLQPVKQENLIRDDGKLILLASLSDSLEFVADSVGRHCGDGSLAAFSDEYRMLAADCLRVLRVEMQLETVFHLQGIAGREYSDDRDGEEPDDSVVSLASRITRRYEVVAPFVSAARRHYVFGGVCGIAAGVLIRALRDVKSINLFGIHQMCRNAATLEQALAAVPNGDLRRRLDRATTFYGLLNLPFESLLAYAAQHDRLFTPADYLSLVRVHVPGRELPFDAEDQLRNACSL